ncbi:FACT complex subunit Ssrp1-like [Armigeres subalbatus]|uniref:FACT complex subunit Ssrp1-like n=1 Tax=Armigeres subalbatus TaxID=124917 RepID=UPI002ED574FF
MLEKELPTRGWNWGTIHFKGSVLSFYVESRTNIEIPLSHVSKCNNGKNEVTVEFHRNDDAPVSLMEMRFHIPMTESAETDPVEVSPDQVMKQASVISATCDAIAIFREIHCLTPGGLYDIKSSVLRLFLLPHKDNRQMLFVISLDPPIKQGQTRYHFLVTLFQTISPPSMEPEYRNWITDLIGHDAAIPRSSPAAFRVHIRWHDSKMAFSFHSTTEATAGRAASEHRSIETNGVSRARARRLDRKLTADRVLTRPRRA